MCLSIKLKMKFLQKEMTYETDGIVRGQYSVAPISRVLI